MAKRNKGQLNQQQQMFVDNYLADPALNATNAAIAAGYSKKTAGVKASQLLKEPLIAKAVEEAMAKRSERTQITQDYVLENLVQSMAMAKGDMPVTETKIIDGEKRTVQIRKTNLTNYNRSIELLGKHLGMFKEEKKEDTSESLVETMADISRRNAQRRSTLLPKDNINFDEE